MAKLERLLNYTVAVEDNALIGETRPVLTSEEAEWFKLIGYSVFSTSICLFGIVANIINIIVFVKQGFENTVNISLCGMAFADFCCLILQLWFNLCLNPLLRDADITFASEEIQYLTGSVPSSCFARLSGWITVYITMERYISIARPLKVKQIITPKKTVIIVGIIYLINILQIIPEYKNYALDWKFYPEKNKTLLGLVINISADRNILAYIFHCIVGYFSYIVLIAATVILARKLSRKSTWRKKATLANDHSKSLASRDQKIVKMIVLIATIMIVCYIPGTFLILYMAFDPSFSILGINKALFYAVWSLGFIFQNTNSSVNIFLYFRMSSKFRNTLITLANRVIGRKSN